MQTHTRKEEQKQNDKAQIEINSRLRTLTPVELTVFLRSAQPGAPKYIGLGKELRMSPERVRNLWRSACRKMTDKINVPQV